ncbi:MAG: PASTA domain-containing protein [Clostridiales bacterium]|nr:PASTA domain-containing protein [Clostridiales bacterium]
MASRGNLCMNCMKDIGDEHICPYCGYNIDSTQLPPFLPTRTIVDGKYLVGRCIESNGEGATYIGRDLSDGRNIFIRELLPNTFIKRTTYSNDIQVMPGCERSFAEIRHNFEILWSKLSGLSGPSAMINVTAVFEAFGTSYAVYDYFNGVTLRDYVLRSRSGYISWEKAQSLLMPLLSCLGVLHSNNIVHGGISPQTLFVTADGKIKLAGFCTLQTRTVGSRVTNQIYDGYAGIEQYDIDGNIGPWTDIYSFCGVLYRCLIGSDPIGAKERVTNDRMMIPGKFAEIIPAYVINGMINALQIMPQDRIQNTEQLRAELSGSPTAAAGSKRKTVAPDGRMYAPKHAALQEEDEDDDDKESGSVKTILITALIVVLVGAAVISALSLTVFRDNIFSNSAVSPTAASTEQSDMVTVPNFVGRGFVEIQTNTVFNSDFLITKEEVYSPDVDAGYVISQSIAPDTQVPKMTKITVTVSKGVEQIVLPDVSGMDFEEAKNQLTELGFEVMKNEVSIGSHKENEVLSVAPMAEKEYDVGTTVYLRVYVSPTTVPPTTKVYTTQAPTEPESLTEIEQSTSAPEETQANEDIQ